ncbi:hypothetical protein C2845_PM09G13470 [Panicum miliaceum]|uniref:Uncharacterized protein n=1 Tax=Panicum miliaceum TaxID=4540 RepID=A0A3L6RWU4_PANMI|nr:hypothetical protein C2845_PM09G13470 [Panicum miliaceum]
MRGQLLQFHVCHRDMKLEDTLIVGWKHRTSPQDMRFWLLKGTARWSCSYTRSGEMNQWRIHRSGEIWRSSDLTAGEHPSCWPWNRSEAEV